MLSPLCWDLCWKGLQTWVSRTLLLTLAMVLIVWLYLVVLSLSVLIYKMGPLFVLKFDNCMK